MREPTEKERRIVYTMTVHGVPVNRIALCLEYSEDDLNKLFAYELQTGREVAGDLMVEALHYVRWCNAAPVPYANMESDTVH